MSTFAKTSFLFAFYFPRADSEHAVAKLQSLPAPPQISVLVRYEFQQAVWFEVWRRANGNPRGLDQTAAQSGLAAFDLDLERGIWSLVRPDWDRVVLRAERLALDHTPRHGARAMDLLHLAFALELGATELLSFDGNQRNVALAEGVVAARSSPAKSSHRAASSVHTCGALDAAAPLKSFCRAAPSVENRRRVVSR